MAFSNGYGMSMAFNLDTLGWFYICCAIFWTAVLCMGITFLVCKRHLPYLRIRNVPLAISAVAVMHIYWVLCLLAYVLQGYFPCSTEYWIMSIYLPLGVALFQACNTQLLHIANVQRKFAHDLDLMQRREDEKAASGRRTYMAQLMVQNRVKRAMLMIAYGMCAQLIVATIIFLVSRKFHPNFGIAGTGYPQSGAARNSFCLELQAQYDVSTCTAAEKIACRRGWEWIPSIVWQFLWSWGYAPYLLWKVRSIQDVHGWRTQTIVCCLAGLFASPLWLCALYVTKMSVVNGYFIPPMWFMPTIVVIEACLIFLPCWQVVKNHRLHSDTLEIIATWESKNNGSSLGGETMQTSSKTSEDSSVSSRRGEMYTMIALETAIRTNPQPLLSFAALKDFSGENISFLTKVIDWKRSWSVISPPPRAAFLRRPSAQEANNKILQRQQFKAAVDIYASCVSLKYSDYAINLSHAHLKELEAVFEPAAFLLYGHRVGNGDKNSATPFDDREDYSYNLWNSVPAPKLKSSSTSPVREAHSPRLNQDSKSVTSQKSHHTIGTDASTDFILHNTAPTAFEKRNSYIQSYEMTDTTCIEDSPPDYDPIPKGFGPEVFDRAEESIKYMVFTNTWPKFVNAGYASTDYLTKKSLMTEIRDRFFHKQAPV